VRSRSSGKPVQRAGTVFSATISNYANGLFGTFTPVATELHAEDHE